MIFSAFEWMVAFRYLRARREEGFISVIAGFSLLGIALGVATLIIVMSVMNGFRAELMERILGLNGHIGVYAGKGGLLREFDVLADRLRSIDGVQTITPIIEGQVMATANDVAGGALVRGLRPADIRIRNIIADNIRAGSLNEFKGRGHIVVGTRFARRFGIGPGDRLRRASRLTVLPLCSKWVCMNTTTVSSSCRLKLLSSIFEKKTGSLIWNCL